MAVGLVPIPVDTRILLQSECAFMEKALSPEKLKLSLCFQTLPTSLLVREPRFSNETLPIDGCIVYASTGLPLISYIQ